MRSALGPANRPSTSSKTTFEEISGEAALILTRMSAPRCSSASTTLFEIGLQLVSVHHDRRIRL